MDKITIGLTGPAGCGKDTIAGFLREFHAFKSFALADPLKAGLSVMFDIEREHFEDRALKELPDEYWGISPRQFAQEGGTEFARRMFGENVWIRRLEKNSNFASASRRVITDVRFNNEADWLRDQGGELWHVSGRGVQNVRSHVSESGVRFRDGDISFFNGYDIEDCEATTHGYVEALLHRRRRCD